MRTFTLLLSAFVLSTAAHAQTVATFDTLSLPGTDTFYLNLSASGSDVGFNDGLAYFPCIYDTTGTGGSIYWNYFAYSNKTDSVTSGFGNQYSAKTGIGYAGSAKYAVAYCANPIIYNDYTMVLKLTGAAIGKPVNGFYVTNSTYAYNSMRDGDAFAHKFHSGDWFLLTVKGYTGGALTADSVNFYLADFLFPDSSMNYIVKTWDWVNLLPLGHIDSLQFQLRSSDTGSGYINTPTYFCMDNFTTNETSLSVNNIVPSYAAKVYPNPAINTLYIDLTDNTVQQVSVMDMAGNVISSYNVSAKHIEINTAALPSGAYLLQLNGEGKSVTTKFVKQ